MMITIRTIIVDCKTDGSTEECILSLGDNTSAIGWLFRTKGIGPDSIYFDAVNLVATRHHKCRVRPTLLRRIGRSNEKASEDPPLAPDNPSVKKLTECFHSFLPQLIPRYFAISPLPNEIASFATLAI
jgi:hypothetical protein